MLQQISVQMLHKPQMVACNADTWCRVIMVHVVFPLCLFTVEVFGWTR